VVAAFTEISNSLCCRDVHGLDFEFFDIRYPVASNRTKSKAFLLQTELDWILCFLNKRDFVCLAYRLSGLYIPTFEALLRKNV